MKIKEFINKLERTYVFPITNKERRKKLKNNQFTIISDNCWGGRIYQELGVQYQSPFVGLFIYKPDYIRLLENFNEYMKLELVETKQSKYQSQLKYPVGLLGDVEIHFLHYQSFEEANKKWESRKKRMHYDQMYFKMNDDDLFETEFAYRFNQLPFKKKVFFSAQKYDQIECNVQIESLKDQPTITRGQDLKKYHRFFDVLEWLNT